MKKSYHSTVVPTMVAATTRRRSRWLMPPPLVASEVFMGTPTWCRDVGVNRRGEVLRVVARTGGHVCPSGGGIVYDFGYKRRPKGPHDRNAAGGHRGRRGRWPFRGAAAQTRQDRGRPPQLRLARRAAWTSPGPSVVLLQAVQLGRAVGE